jgi:hypothetical protein
VRLLREVSDEMNVTYNKGHKKVQLIEKVKEARKTAESSSMTSDTPMNVDESISGPQCIRTPTSATFTRGISVLYYFDQKKNITVYYSKHFISSQNYWRFLRICYLLFIAILIKYWITMLISCIYLMSQ